MIIAPHAEQPAEMMHATGLAAHRASGVGTTDRLLDHSANLPGCLCVAITANVGGHLWRSCRVPFREGRPEGGAERKVEAQRSQLVFDLPHRKQPPVRR